MLKYSPAQNGAMWISILSGYGKQTFNWWEMCPLDLARMCHFTIWNPSFFCIAHFYTTMFYISSYTFQPHFNKWRVEMLTNWFTESRSRYNIFLTTYIDISKYRWLIVSRMFFWGWEHLFLDSISSIMCYYLQSVVVLIKCQSFQHQFCVNLRLFWSILKLYSQGQ